MRPSRERRAVAVALRCYPRRWRLRHGGDAEWLASALLDDGVAWWSIAANFLVGAAKERMVARPSVRVGSALAAVAIGASAVPLALLTSLTPASASSANVVIVVSKPADAARELEFAFAAHHFRVSVTEKAVPTRLNGSILSVSVAGTASSRTRVVAELRATCSDGRSGCTYGLELPRHFSGLARVTIGRATP
jgi:hypothetical protein